MMRRPMDVDRASSLHIMNKDSQLVGRRTYNRHCRVVTFGLAPDADNLREVRHMCIHLS